MPPADPTTPTPHATATNGTLTVSYAGVDYAVLAADLALMEAFKAAAVAGVEAALGLVRPQPPPPPPQPSPPALEVAGGGASPAHARQSPRGPQGPEHEGGDAASLAGGVPLGPPGVPAAAPLTAVSPQPGPPDSGDVGQQPAPDLMQTVMVLAREVSPGSVRVLYDIVMPYGAGADPLSAAAAKALNQLQQQSADGAVDGGVGSNGGVDGNGAPGGSGGDDNDIAGGGGEGGAADVTGALVTRELQDLFGVTRASLLAVSLPAEVGSRGPGAAPAPVPVPLPGGGGGGGPTPGPGPGTGQELGPDEASSPSPAILGVAICLGGAALVVAAAAVVALVRKRRRQRLLSGEAPRSRRPGLGAKGAVEPWMYPNALATTGGIPGSREASGGGGCTAGGGGGSAGGSDGGSAGGRRHSAAPSTADAGTPPTVPGTPLTPLPVRGPSSIGVGVTASDGGERGSSGGGAGSRAGVASMPATPPRGGRWRIASPGCQVQGSGRQGASEGGGLGGSSSKWVAQRRGSAGAAVAAAQAPQGGSEPGAQGLAAAKRRRAGADVEALALASREEHRSPSRPSPARRTHPRDALAFERTSPTCGAALRPTARQGQGQVRGRDSGGRLSPTWARGSAGRRASGLPGAPTAKRDSGGAQQPGPRSPERPFHARDAGWVAQRDDSPRTAGGLGDGGGTRQPAALTESPGAGGGGSGSGGVSPESSRLLGPLSALPVHPLRDPHERRHQHLAGGSGHAGLVGPSCLPGAASPGLEPDVEPPLLPPRLSRAQTDEGPEGGHGGGGGGGLKQPLRQHAPTEGAQDCGSSGSRNDSGGGGGGEELAAVIALPLSLERISAGRRLPPAPHHMLLQPPAEGSQRSFSQESVLGLQSDTGEAQQRG